MSKRPKPKGTKRRPGRTSTRAIERAERRLQIVALRRQKKNLDEIAKEMAITPQAACQLLQRIIQDIDAETAEMAGQLRAEQLAGIKALLTVSLRRALKGDQQATDRTVRLWDREAKLMGLDSPTDFEFSGKGGVPLATPVILLPSPARDDEAASEESVSDVECRGSDPNSSPG